MTSVRYNGSLEYFLHQWDVFGHTIRLGHDSTTEYAMNMWAELFDWSGDNSGF